MPYSDAQARLIMARAHGAKLKRKKAMRMSQATAREMMAEIPASQRSRAMTRRSMQRYASNRRVRTVH